MNYIKRVYIWCKVEFKPMKPTKHESRTSFLACHSDIVHLSLNVHTVRKVWYQIHAPLTSQSYSSLSCSMIHSSRTSLFRSSFLSYLTVTLPCFFWTGSSPAVMGPDPTQPTPVAAWKKTRLPAVGSGALVSVLAADIAGCGGLSCRRDVWMSGGAAVLRGTGCCTADRRLARSF